MKMKFNVQDNKQNKVFQDIIHHELDVIKASLWRRNLLLMDGGQGLK